MEDNNEVTDETKPSLSNIFHNKLFTSAISIVFSPKLAKNLTGHDKDNHKRKEKEDLYSSINIALIISQHSKTYLHNLSKYLLLKDWEHTLKKEQDIGAHRIH